MIKPKSLKVGDTIGVIASSSPTTPERVALAKESLEKLGFNVKLSPSCHQTHGYLAGEDQLRADDINNVFGDKDIDGIICLRGGYGAPKILDKIDYQIIRDNPKVFVGYSDITALHIAFTQQCQLVTFHGPMAASDMAGGLDDFSKESLLKAIMGDQPMGTLDNPEGTEIKTLVGGVATGEIIGGNLALIAATMGTPYQINTKGKLLLLEDIGEEPYRVDRMLTQLLLGGVLHDAEGIILGDWNDCDPKDKDKSLSLMEVFEEIIVPVGKPTIYDLKAGHCSPKITVPFGIKATMDADKGIVTIEEKATL